EAKRKNDHFAFCFACSAEYVIIFHSNPTRKSLKMSQNKELEAIFKRYGFSNFKWIEPENIVVSEWVRMKCRYGCDEYGRTATCPPEVPSVSDCRGFFREYKKIAVFAFPKKVDKPEDRYAWARELNLKLLDLEREVFTSGYQKTFLLFLDSCGLCEACPGAKRKCKKPEMARPTAEALAMDVFSTIRQINYPIEVLSDYSQEMNRYAFLLIE
ncbi:DUF2284 domain-containing protein, partial [Acidobacteriota bacterium]